MTCNGASSLRRTIGLSDSYEITLINKELADETGYENIALPSDAGDNQILWVLPL